MRPERASTHAAGAAQSSRRRRRRPDHAADVPATLDGSDRTDRALRDGDGDGDDVEAR